MSSAKYGLFLFINNLPGHGNCIPAVVGAFWEEHGCGTRTYCGLIARSDGIYFCLSSQAIVDVDLLSLSLFNLVPPLCVFFSLFSFPALF